MAWDSRVFPETDIVSRSPPLMHVAAINAHRFFDPVDGEDRAVSTHWKNPACKAY